MSQFYFCVYHALFICIKELLQVKQCQYACTRVNDLILFPTNCDHMIGIDRQRLKLLPDLMSAAFILIV